jgi:hypothetical protein
VLLDEVSLAYLIERTETREAVVEADRCISENRLQDALESIALALAREFRARSLDHRPSSPNGIGLRGAEGWVISAAIKDLRKAVDGLFSEVELLRHGIDTRRLEVFRQLTPSVFIAHAGNATFTHIRHRDPSKEEVNFCYDFVIDAVLNLQEQDAAVRGLAVYRPRLRRG